MMYVFIPFVHSLCITVVDCGSPPGIDNGSPGTPDMTTFGGTVTYTCNNGYEISTGATMMTASCLATGDWDTVTCTGISNDSSLC